ncbi:hypothetical protein ACWD4X_21725 [Streptomyces termitum]
MDQFDMFLRYAGIQREERDRLLNGVGKRHFSAVGVYLVNDAGLRILEAEVAVDWRLHADLTRLSPTVRTDLPGWESGAAPEIVVIGERFGKVAREKGLRPRYWVKMTHEIQADEPRYQAACAEAGVTPRSGVPAWASEPLVNSHRLPDLSEVCVVIRRPDE